MLIYISEWYTGNQNNWKIIEAANPGLDPNQILIGDEIIIPEELVKRREPMPRKKFPSSQDIETPSPPASQSKDESVDIELFGPVGVDQTPPESTNN
jgi:hypothetical protein